MVDPFKLRSRFARAARVALIVFVVAIVASVVTLVLVPSPPKPPLSVELTGSAAIRSTLPGVEGPAVKAGGVLLGTAPGACNRTGHTLDALLSLSFNPVNEAGTSVGAIPYVTLSVPVKPGCTKDTKTTQQLPEDVTPGRWRASLVVQFMRRGSQKVVATVSIVSPDFTVVA